MTKASFKFLFLTPIIVAILSLGACNDDEIIDERLSELVNSELTTHDNSNPSPELINLYEDTEVLIFGEAHYVQEFHDFYVDQLSELSQSGYRVIHNELFHCFSWMVNDYVTGEIDELPEFILFFDETILEGIRAFNATVPDSLMFSYKYFDLNHWDSNIKTCVEEIEKILGSHEIFDRLKNTTVDANNYQSVLTQLTQELSTGKDLLINDWGEVWYYRIVEIIEVEKTSSEFRINRSNDLREQLMFDVLADDILNPQNGKNIIISGISHAFKASTPNTGYERLATKITNSNDKTSSLFFTAFRGARKSRFFDTNNITFNLIESSDKDDIVIQIHKVNNSATTFLPLEDPYFMENTLKLSTITNTFQEQVGLVFDGVILIPQVSVLESMNKYDWQ